MGNIVTEESRREIIAILLAASAPRDEAALCADMICHAVNEAFAAVGRTVEAAPKELWKRRLFLGACKYLAAYAQAIIDLECELEGISPADRMAAQ